MIRNYLQGLMIIVIAFVVGILPCCISFAQDIPEDLQHKPANLGILATFMDKLGYHNYKLIKAKNLHGLAFIVRDKKAGEIIKFSTLLNPNDLILKFECHDLATVPSNPKKLNLLLQRLAEMNGMRTLGKYYVNSVNKNLQYFYFQSVVGGICFADFQRTLKLIELIVFKDLKTLNDPNFIE
jgi:hypothetical protein